jgi:hypothetical protein
MLTSFSSILPLEGRDYPDPGMAHPFVEQGHVLLIMGQAIQS